MDVPVYRLLLAGAALCPAALLAAAPVSSAFLPFGIVIGSAGGLLALLSSFRPGKPRRRGPALLRRAALRRAGSDLPTLHDQRLAIAKALEAAVDLRAEPDAPPTRETAIARILTRILDSWNASDIAALPRDLTLTLTLLKQCLKAPLAKRAVSHNCFSVPTSCLACARKST